MRFVGHIPSNDDWVEQLFSAKAVQTGGVVRRKTRDVERKIGRDRLELEVRRRGFRLIEVGDQLVVICSTRPIRVLV